MAYTPKNWNDGQEGGTPITAADLNHIETQYAQAVSDAANDATTKASGATSTAAADATAKANNAQSAAISAAQTYTNSRTPAASTTTAGVSRFSTTAEASTGTLTTVGVTPAGLTAAITARAGGASQYGTYAARPAASAVSTGTIYFASDTQETYRSNGSTWNVVAAGGNELAYAEVVSNYSVTVDGGRTMQDVTGLVITLTVPERPFMIKVEALGQYTSTTNDGIIRVTDVTPATPVDVLETHVNRNATSTTFTQVFAERRITGLTPGTQRSYKVAVMRQATAWLVAGSATYPFSIQAVTV